LSSYFSNLGASICQLQNSYAPGLCFIQNYFHFFGDMKITTEIRYSGGDIFPENRHIKPIKYNGLKVRYFTLLIIKLPVHRCRSKPGNPVRSAVDRLNHTSFFESHKYWQCAIAQHIAFSGVTSDFSDFAAFIAHIINGPTLGQNV
jgi:hypothetical protein